MAPKERIRSIDRTVFVHTHDAPGEAEDSSVLNYRHFPPSKPRQFSLQSVLTGCLKRAQELVGVGQSQAALALLHEHVTSKRTRNSPLASIEPVMLLFIELGVELKRGKNIKDGLYSYKNLSQNSSVQSLELVVTKYIELAEQKLAEAQAKAEEVQSGLESSTSTANVDDLEATETPESILLSTVSGEVSKDRTDRAIVTPWVYIAYFCIPPLTSR